MNNRKRTKGRKIQTIIVPKNKTKEVDGIKIKHPDAGKIKQIKHNPMP